MIKKSQKLQQFERDYICSSESDPSANFRIANALYEEAVELGIFPLHNPLEGLNIDIKIAKIVNDLSKSP